ncbi:MAG: hypothetical protein FIO02_04095 [Nitrosopumilales archaeon]|nr:hypothetical protein [Thermoproteota archaeon]MRN40207.1 hypothetical protein [Nitrosopumilales archaeon]
MRQVTLSQDVIAIEKSEAAATTTDNQLQESLDCPDCSDTMLKFYDWDKMKYLCENCGLTINNPLLLRSTFIA